MIPLALVAALRAVMAAAPMPSAPIPAKYSEFALAQAGPRRADLVPTAGVPPRPVVTTEPGRPITSDDAARIALALQPSLVLARANRDALEGRATQVAAGLGPQVNLGLGYTATNNLSNNGAGGVIIDPVTGGTINTGGGAGGSRLFRTNATASQLLFDFGRTRDLASQARANARAGGYALTRTGLDVALDARTRLYNLVQARRLVAVAQANLDNRSDQLRLAQAQFDAGVGQPSDLVRAKTAVADAVQALVAARRDEDANRVLLNLALGLDGRTPLDPDASTEPALEEGAVDALVEQGLLNRPEIAQFAETIRGTESGLSAARRGNSPALVLSLGLAGRGQSDPVASPTNTIGFALSFPIFDSGLTRGRIAEARANRDAASANLALARQTVVSDVATAYLDANAAAQRVAAAEIQAVDATELVRITEGRYAGGIGTFLEITVAQDALFTARRALEIARADLSRARAALRRAVGEGLPL